MKSLGLILVLLTHFPSFANEIYQPKNKTVDYQLSHKIVESKNNLKIIITNNSKTQESPPILPLSAQLINTNYEVLKDSCSHFTLNPQGSCYLELKKNSLQGFSLKVKMYDSPLPDLNINYFIKTKIDFNN